MSLHIQIQGCIYLIHRKFYFILLVQLQLLPLIKTSEVQTHSSVIAFLNLPLIITFSKAVSKIRKAETNGKLDFSLN